MSTVVGTQQQQLRANVKMKQDSIDQEFKAFHLFFWKVLQWFAGELSRKVGEWHLFLSLYKLIAFLCDL
jgi:hypothetical protein